MKNKIVKVSVTGAVILMSALPTFAQVGVDANLNINASTNSGGASTNASVNATSSKGVQAIGARINSLTNLSARIADMSRLTAEQKTSLRATLQSEISDFMALQTKMQTSTTTLKADFQALGANGRIYALVEPQISILAAINRADNIVTMLKTVAGKLEVRIQEASSTEDHDDLVEALADMNAELNEASAKASTSQSLIINLKPDNGVQSVMKSNLEALKKARSTLRDAAQDLNDARKAAVMIMSDLKINASAAASVKSQN